jgi:hypothetical protein
MLQPHRGPRRPCPLAPHRLPDLGTRGCGLPAAHGRCRADRHHRRAPCRHSAAERGARPTRSVNAAPAGLCTGRSTAVHVATGALVVFASSEPVVTSADLPGGSRAGRLRFPLVEVEPHRDGVHRHAAGEPQERTDRMTGHPRTPGQVREPHGPHYAVRRHHDDQRAAAYRRGAPSTMTSNPMPISTPMVSPPFAKVTAATAGTRGSSAPRRPAPRGEYRAAGGCRRHDPFGCTTSGVAVKVPAQG